VLSILFHTRRGYKPKNAVITADPSGKLHVAPVSSQAQVIPGLMIYRFQHSMYYANAEHLSEEVLELVNSAQPPLSWFCIDATAVDDIDYSAAATLREIHTLLKEKGVRLVFAAVGEVVRRELDVSEVTDLVGEDAYFETLDDLEGAYQAATADESS
jgi:MFS superfamily sulfate permease-like transporter